MTNAVETDENYTIKVTDKDGRTILAGEGGTRVLFYMSQVAIDTLDALGDEDPEADATVAIYHGETRLLGATIDAGSAAGLIQRRINKLRASLKAAEDAPAAG